jgi:hypothetical protein
MDHYPAKYSDSSGSEITTILNDGATLRVSLRGLEFVGNDFDSLEPPRDATPEQLGRFLFHHGCLCWCRIECRIPIPVHDRGRPAQGDLVVELVLGGPTPNGQLDREQLRLVLEYGDQRIASAGTSGWFEDELLGIQARLPDGVYMKACINCLSSDYSPYGHGLFGCMLCFRDLKAEYVKVTTKDEYWPVLERCDLRVQETYLCPEFTRRTPGTGYRG